jgi:hypothetical protein
MAKDAGAMDPGQLKAKLRVATSRPVNCAIGMPGTPGPALLLVNDKKPPKTLEKELKEQFADNKGIRWGTVAIDEKGTAVFTINRQMSGLARGLVKAVKGTVAKKVVLQLEDGSPLESAGEEESEAVADGPPPTPTENRPDAQQIAALTRRLGELVKRAASTSSPEELTSSAREAAMLLKSGDTKAAEATIERLEELLSQPAPISASPVPVEKVVKLQKLWQSLEKRVDSEISAFKHAVDARFKGDPEYQHVATALAQLDAITAKFDGTLVDCLDKLARASDAGEASKLLTSAKTTLEDYAGFIESNTLVQKLSGDTPFGVKLSVGPTMSAVIKTAQMNLS